MNIKTIKDAYSELRISKIAYHSLETKRAQMEADYKIAALNGEVSGAVAGKNAGQREAAAIELYAGEYKAWQAAERKAADAKLELDVAQINVEEVRALLRLEEITQ